MISRIGNNTYATFERGLPCLTSTSPILSSRACSFISSVLGAHKSRLLQTRLARKRLFRIRISYGDINYHAIFQTSRDHDERQRLRSLPLVLRVRSCIGLQYDIQCLANTLLFYEKHGSNSRRDRKSSELGAATLFPELLAICLAVFPFFDLTRMSTPWSTSHLTASIWPLLAAICNAVQPLASALFTSQPCSTRASMH